MLLSILIASTKTLSVYPRYSLHFPLTHLPSRGTVMNHASTSVMAIPISGSRPMPLSLTDTLHTARELRPAAVAEHGCTQTVMPAKCVPLELPLNNCSVWPQRRGTVAFSLSLWLRVDSDRELTSASDSALSSESTTDLDLSPTSTGTSALFVHTW